MAGRDSDTKVINKSITTKDSALKKTFIQRIQFSIVVGVAFSLPEATPVSANVVYY